MVLNHTVGERLSASSYARECGAATSRMTIPRRTALLSGLGQAAGPSS